MRKLLAIGLLSLPTLALSGPSIKVALNYDSTVNTAYRSGNKPQGGACPTGWTCATKGDATIDPVEVSSSSFTLTVSGLNDEANIGYIYKSTASANDIEIVAKIPATWTGHLENFTTFGVGVTEGTGDAAYASQCAWPNIGTSVKFKSDAGGAGEQSQDGLANQSLPYYVAITYDNSETALKCWESSDNAAWTQVGTTITKTLTFPVLGYVFGTSHHSTNTTTATLTDIAHSNTLTIGVGGGGPGDGAPNDAPVWNSTPVVSCTAGTGKEITIANSANTTDTTQRVSDADGDALTLTQQGCTWPVGVTVNDTTDTVDCATTTVAGSTASCKIGADDGTAARQDSAAFTIDIAAAGGGAEDATIIWTGLLEGGAGDIAGGANADFKKKIAGQGAITVVASSDGGQCPVRQGTKMARMEIPAGASGNPQRAELKSVPGQFFDWDGTEYWVGYSFCVESFTGTVNTLFQIHAPNEGPGECDMAGNLVGNHSDGQLEIIENPSGISEASGANSNHIVVYDLDLRQAANQDKWHDFVINFKVNTDRTGVKAACNGMFQAWHQGTLVYSATNRCNVNYKDACGTTIAAPKNRSNGLHVGLYQSNTTNRVLYYDAMRIAIGDQGFNTVNPAQND